MRLRATIVSFFENKRKKMLGFLLYAVAVLGTGLDIHDWVALPRNKMVNIVRNIPVWDYNETCVHGGVVKLGGKYAHFGASEIRAWNTAIMFAVESGIVPEFISTGKC